MEDEKFKDLLEDEELQSLRLAALASKRKKEENVNKTVDTAPALPINSIVTSSASEITTNQIPFVQHSDRNAFNNVYQWRKQNQSLRRRGGPFPKNTRSNLIVINPVPLNDDKDLHEKAPPLVLPQHKWCNSANEDSMSPKTLRRTGPTRFNRHGSDSESSESDYEDENDSGSNETVLQDEPTEHFSRLSPESDTVTDCVEKKRRLSFQNLDSDMKPDTFDKSEATSIYNLLKNPFDCSDNKPESYAPVQNQNDGRHTWNCSAENDYNSYKQFNTGNAYIPEPLDSSDKFANKLNSLATSNGESVIETNSYMQSSKTHTWQHTDTKNVSSCYSKETSSIHESSRSQGVGDRKPKNYSEKRRISSEIQNSENTVWQHGEGLRSNKPFFQREGAYNAVDSRSYKEEDVKTQFLSEGDLRFELKNRTQEMKSKSSSVENHGEKVENRRFSQSNMWDRNNQKNSYEGKLNDSCVNRYGNKQDSSNLNRKRYDRSLSRERTKEDGYSSRDRSKYGYSSGPERSRRDRSSSLDRNRHERSASRGRRGRSSSQDKKRREHSSSQGMIKNESVQDSNRCGYNSSPNRNKRARSGSAEKDGQSKNFQERNSSQNENNSSSQNKSSYEWRSSEYKSRRSYSSSSDSRSERSVSRDSERDYRSDRSRSKRERSVSRDKKRYDRSSSRDKSRRNRSLSQERSKRTRSFSRDRSRSRHWSTDSRDSRDERSRNSRRSRHEGSLSRDESDEGHSSGHGRSYKHTSRNSRSMFKTQNSNQHKSSCDITSNLDKDKQESVSAQEKDPNSFEVKKSQSEGIRENIKFEKSTPKKEYKSTTDGSRLRSSSEERKTKGKKLSPKKHSGISDSTYKNRYSRSRSSSSSSYSSSSSSSSTRSSRPKIRSVSSVIKPVPAKSLDIQNKETLGETKSSGKIVINIQSDVSSSSKKNANVGNYNKSSNFKGNRVDVDFKASDNSKRVPVHMRLGTLPRKRVIQMPKDVEAAFVNSSSSSDGENVNTKCKRPNIRIVTDVFDDKSGFDFEKKHSLKEKSARRSPTLTEEKSKRLKIER